jgi:hypothetical protein
VKSCCYRPISDAVDEDNGDYGNDDDDDNDNNKLGKVYSLEYTEIPKVLFTPHHRL